MAIIARLATGVLDTVFPPRCASCRRRGVWVCDDCLPSIVRFVPPLCDRCGMPIGLAACRCPEMAPEIAAHRSVGAYGGWLRSAIIAFKYGDERARDAHLGKLLATIAPGPGRIDGLVPVPLHRRRMRERGFNQAELLVRQIQIRTSTPVLNALQRTRATPRQVGLSGVDRTANVADAFELARSVDVTGLRLALVDDVCTTGSTLGACAKTLVRHGAAEVLSLTLAREL
jgi:ComF family protein